MSLHGQVALVTGGGQGIGRAISEILAERGATVIVSDLDLGGAEAVASAIVASGKQAHAMTMNVSMSEEVKAVVAKLLERQGRIDILVNNAGVTHDALMVRIKDDDWRRVLSVNLDGAFYCMRAVLPVMAKKGCGRVVNVSSVIGVTGNAGQASYAASKAALVGLTKTAAREYASRGITVNAVAPGFIDTAMTARLSPAVREGIIKQVPLTRLGTPVDVARAVSFLVSEEGSYITGQVLHVNGGLYMGS